MSKCILTLLKIYFIDIKFLLFYPLTEQEVLKRIKNQYDYENNKITLDTREITPSNITTKGAWVFKLDNYINYIQK